MRMYNRLWPFLYRLCQAINEMKENSCLILPYVPANSDYKIHAVGLGQRIGGGGQVARR